MCVLRGLCFRVSVKDRFRLKGFGLKVINFPLIWPPFRRKTASNTIWKILVRHSVKCDKRETVAELITNLYEGLIYKDSMVTLPD